MVQLVAEELVSGLNDMAAEEQALQAQAEQPTTTEGALGGEEAPKDEGTKSEEVSPELSARLKALEDENAKLREPLQRYEQVFADLERQELQKYTDSVTAKLAGLQDEEGNPVLTEKDQQDLKTVITDAMEYRKVKGTVEKLNLTGAALDYAYDIVGDGGTVGELKKIAGELVALGDVRLMERWVPHMQQLRRTQVAETRKTIDNTTSSTPTGGSATDFNSLENEFAFHEETMSPQRQALYLKMRAQRQAQGLL